MKIRIRKKNQIQLKLQSKNKKNIEINNFKQVSITRKYNIKFKLKVKATIFKIRMIIIKQMNI